MVAQGSSGLTDCRAVFWVAVFPAALAVLALLCLLGLRLNPRGRDAH